jgi:farnesyl-diphosphate farnesyltransferase
MYANVYASVHLTEFSSEKFAYLQEIKTITEQMGNGMADFIESEVLTVEDYDKYCHYVAGLVGIGLSKVACPFSVRKLI